MNWMIRLSTLTLLLFGITFTNTSIAQETAPVKAFDYTLSLTGIKTEAKAENVEQQIIDNIQGIAAVELVFLEYKLYFSTTNRAMQEYAIMQEIKNVLSRNKVEIQRIIKKETD